MAKFDIISKNGESVRLSGCPKYTGTFLGVSFLEFSSIESPVLIDWEIGDYIDYERTGLRYKLYSLPIPKKQARGGSYGASFVYPNVKFYAETKDLEIAPFRDIVPEDNNIHFSTRPDVSTYENVYGIARRIQACMDDVFPGKWRIEVYNTDDESLLEILNETKDFSISDSNCLQTLSQIYEKWENVGWIHSYDEVAKVNVITIGRASVRDNGNTSDVFAYGLGNGLTSIKKAAANEDEFATRLYVYGSDRNIQTRYYNSQNILNAESVDIRNLMLPINTWGRTDGLPDARKAYLEADASIIEKYGLIPRTVYFDGSQDEAIYPSIQGLKMSQVRAEMIAAGKGDSEHLPPDKDIRIDKSGAIILEIGDGSKEEVESNRTFTLSLPMVGFNIEEQGRLTSERQATISFKSGPCAGREFKVKSYLGQPIGTPNGYCVYECYRNWDESLGMGFPNTTYFINDGDEYVLLDIPMPDYYITLAEKRLLEAGRKRLAECTKISPYYEPAIDPIRIKESGKSLREGMYMQISDPDIVDTEDGKDYVLIDTLTIDEKSELPKYSVTLRKQKRASKSLSALESRIGASEKSLSNLTNELSGKSDAYTKAYVDDLLKKYVLLEALSQTIKGELVLDGNLTVRGNIFTAGQFAAAAVGAEGGGGGAAYLADLYDVSLRSLLSGDILSWNGSEWVNIKQSSLVPDLSAYASKSFVSDALEGYLPKSGGTISGNLLIGAENNTAYNYIRIWRNNKNIELASAGDIAVLSFNGVGFAFNETQALWNGNTLLHSGNYSDYALPRSGGTISGSLQIGNDDNTAYNYLRLVREGYEMSVNCNAYGGYISYGAIGAANAQLRLVSDSITFNGNTLIHSGNYSDYALPLSGGTISYNADWGLKLSSLSGSSNYLWFEGIVGGSTNLLGALGMGSYNGPVCVSPTGVSNTLLHAGNYSQYALPLSGGILSDSWSGGTEIRRSDFNNGYASLIFSQADGTILGRFGFGGVDNPLFITQSGAYNTLIHSGNIGSQSVAYASNAGTLSGVSLNNGSNTPWGTIPMITEYGWMDVGRQFEFHYDNTTGSDYSTVLRCAGNYGNSVILPSASGTLALTTDNVASADVVAKTYANENINYNGNESRIRLISGYASNSEDLGFPARYVSGISVLTNYTGWQMVSFCSSAVPNPYYRAFYDNGARSDWRQLAFLDDNVASATKLETPRTIWGQSFDGTGNVDGYMHMSGLDVLHLDESNLWLNYGAADGGKSLRLCGNDVAIYYGKSSNFARAMTINPSGNVTIGGSDLAGSDFSLVISGNQRIYRKHSDNTFLDITLGDVSAYYNGYDPDGWMSHYFQSNGKTCMSIMGYSGNVLVGTTTDNGEKLQVNGNIRLATGTDSSIGTPYDSANTNAYNRIVFGADFTGLKYYSGSWTNGNVTVHEFLVGVNNSSALRIYNDKTVEVDGPTTIYSTLHVTDTLTAQNGIVTNQITIGGIKLDVYNGALRVNGDIFSTGQFAASVAGEATGGSNLILDYASIVNALGYTPANNNNLAQVAFTGSYSSLSGTPDVYTKADVYNKNEINQKLAGVGGGGGSIGSTFGIDYINGQVINGQVFNMPNGVNCITSYSEATVDFSSIVPADPSLPCIIYIVKCDYHTLQVTSGCNIVSVNSSGDEVIDFSINGMTGMMLVWEPDYWRWFAYLQK